MGAKLRQGKAKHSLSACGWLLAAVLAALIAGSGQGASWAAETGPVVDDWTHHRLMFSDPGTLSDAIRAGRVGEWLHVMNDPRYHLQQRKQRAALEGGARFEERLKELGERERFDHDKHDEPKRKPPQGKLPRGSVSAEEVARILGVQLPPREKRAREHPKASGALRTDWSEDMGSNATVGIGNFPAKFSFSLTTVNCGNVANPDFVVYNTDVQGEPGPTTGQATVIAYDNLYSGCSVGTVPSVYWAYNTGTGSTVANSVILSLDGTQVAFAQSNGTSATLVILKWAQGAGTATNPTPLSPISASLYRSCSAPCMTTISFSGGANDTQSSPYYDYTTGSDTLYIGDDSGKLHKFTGVFAGTPAELTTSPWPKTVSTQPLSSPILDGAAGRIFVGDYSPNFITGEMTSFCGTVGCGKIYSVTTAGSVTGTSGTLDPLFGIVDSPLVDETAGTLYAFAGADGSTSCSGSNPCSGVYQLAASFTSGTGTEAQLGTGFLWLLSGSFDNAYFTSANSGSPTGHIYVSGDTGNANNTLYQVTITSNVMSTSAVAGPELADNFTASDASQFGFGVTEISNGTHDFIFVSVLNDGFPSGCGGTGCVIGYDVSGTFSSSMTPVFATAEAGGTSGIIVDNTSSFSGASQIYFTPLGNQSCPTSGGTGGCAIQTSQ